LPKRRGRNEDPVGKRAKAVKAAAKKADKGAKVTEKERKEVEAEAAKDKLAEIEENESFIQGQKQRGRIRRQSEMGASRSNDLDNSEEEFGDLMGLDFSSDASDSETNGELATPTKKQGHGAAAAAAPMVGFHHLNCHFNKTHHYIQTNTKGKNKPKPKLRDEVTVRRNNIKEAKTGGNK
jgi:hypothetical protein